jgi:hypothetical protein
MHKIYKILIFSAILTVFCTVYIVIAPHQTQLSHSSWRNGIGEAVGSGVLWLFAIIYGRTLLKISLRQGPLLERLLPEGIWNSYAVPWARKLLRLLNQSHPYIGAAVVIMVLGHAWLEGFSQANFHMRTVVALILWQFSFGLFLLNRYQIVFIKKMKKYGYLAHSQLYTGIAIGIGAIFGHLLVSN